MDKTPYIQTLTWTGGLEDYPNTTMKTSENDAFVAAIAEKLRQEGREQAYKSYQLIIDGKEKEIQQLREEIEKLRRSTPLSKPPTYDTGPREYIFNAANLPPEPIPIIKALIDVANGKCSGTQFLIEKKTDWYILWKTAYYFKVYSGSAASFIDFVNDCILPNLKDKTRQEKLSVKVSNFNGINSTYDYKSIPVDKWRRELQKQRDAHPNCESSLERGINIAVHLNIALSTHGVSFANQGRI